MIRRCLVVAILTTSACVGSPAHPVADAAAPSFAPIAFFTGRTEGNGHLKAIMARTRAMRVQGEGRKEPDGTLTLIQKIKEEGKADRTRRWSLRSTGAGTFAADLSDAAGPVSVTVDGNLLHIRFHARGGLAIEQWLTLRPGGKTAQNHLVARKWGIRVAVLDETIRKID